MKKTIYFFIVFIFLVLCLVLLTGCGKDSKSSVSWPYEQQYIPSGGFNSSTQEKQSKIFYKTDMSNQEFLSYINTLKEDGFELNILESEFDSFEHLNRAGNSDNYIGKVKICLVKGFAGDENYKKLNIIWYDKQVYQDNTNVAIDNALEITIK